jgi:hypothetical protein
VKEKGSSHISKFSRRALRDKLASHTGGQLKQARRIEFASSLQLRVTSNIVFVEKYRLRSSVPRGAVMVDIG